MWMNTTDPMGDINPGNSIQVKVAFDVRLARRAGGEDQPGEARAAHGQATSLAPAGH